MGLDCGGEGASMTFEGSEYMLRLLLDLVSLTGGETSSLAVASASIDRVVDVDDGIEDGSFVDKVWNSRTISSSRKRDDHGVDDDGDGRAMLNRD